MFVIIENIQNLEIKKISINKKNFFLQFLGVGPIGQWPFAGEAAGLPEWTARGDARSVVRAVGEEAPVRGHPTSHGNPSRFSDISGQKT